METFNLSADYILWAHGPGAEDGQALADELCTRAEQPNRRGQAAIPADRLDLVFEIISVAELYIGGADNDLRAARVRQRAQSFLNTFPAAEVQAARSAWRSAVEGATSDPVYPADFQTPAGYRLQPIAEYDAAAKMIGEHNDLVILLRRVSHALEQIQPRNPTAGAALRYLDRIGERGKVPR